MVRIKRYVQKPTSDSFSIFHVNRVHVFMRGKIPSSRMNPGILRMDMTDLNPFHYFLVKRTMKKR